MSESDAGYLRRQAQRCRRLARSINDDGVIDELEKLARELDAQAAKIEAEQQKS